MWMWQLKWSCCLVTNNWGYGNTQFYLYLNIYTQKTNLFKSYGHHNRGEPIGRHRIQQTPR